MCYSGVKHIEELKEFSQTIPAVNQIEVENLLPLVLQVVYLFKLFLSFTPGCNMRILLNIAKRGASS